MKKCILYMKVVLFFVVAALVCLCISWVGDVFRAASYLPWYKLVGTAALLFAVVAIAILSIHADRNDAERKKRRMVIETEFEWGGELDKYFRSRGIDTDAGKADFVERAATAAAFEENKKGWD